MSAHSSRNRLAVALLTQDDAEHLPKTFKSLQGITSRVIVYDLGSQDESVKIAGEWGAEVIEGDFDDDYAKARNACLGEMEKDDSLNWILWLNAGEELEPETSQGFVDFLLQEAAGDSCYYLVLNAPSQKKDAALQQKIDLRLMPLRKSLRFAGRIRETLRPSMETAGVGSDVAPGRILCDARLQDPEYMQQRARRHLFLAQLQEEMPQRYEFPEVKFGSLLEKAEALQELREYAASRQTYLQVIAESNDDPQILEAYYGLLSTFDHVPNLVDHQLQYAIDALEKFPLDLQLLTLMASYMQRLKKHELAIRALHTAVNHGQVMLEVWHGCNVKEVAVSCLCMLLQLTGQPEAACRILEECVVLEESPRALMRKLLDLYVSLGREKEALELVERMFRDSKEKMLIKDVMLGACHAVRKEWKAALGYLQSAYVGGCEDVLCLRWLSVVLLSNGQLEEAVPVLQEWKNLEPDNLELKAYLEAIRQPAQFHERLGKMQDHQSAALSGGREKEQNEEQTGTKDEEFQAEDFGQAKFRVDAPEPTGSPLSFPQPKVLKASDVTERNGQ